MHTILIVDDDEGIRGVLRAALSREGYEVVEAGEGTDAIEIAERVLPDLVVLDIMIPGTNGLVLCQQLMSDDRFLETSVVFLSATDETADRTEAMEHGAVDFVSKPFNLADLLARIRLTLRASARGRQSASKRLAALERKQSDHDHEMSRAGVIQRCMLPPSAPEIDWLEVYGQQLPATDVCGDYYDFIERGDDLVISIGDVAGKGVPAALVMVLARTFLNQIDLNVLDTRLTLSGLNQQLYRNTAPGVFMTMVLFKWEAATKQMCFTGAGHEHLLVYRASSRTVDVIKAGGQALGLRPDILGTLEERELDLRAHDTLLLYTDGVTEAQDKDGEQYGMLRLMERFEQLGTSTPEEIVKQIFYGVETFSSGCSQIDDITVVAIRRR